MRTKRKGPASPEPNTFKTVKRFKGTKVIVHTEILARTHDGQVITNNSLPNGLQCLIVCKIAMLEMEIETMIDNYLKRNDHGRI